MRELHDFMIRENQCCIRDMSSDGDIENSTSIGIKTSLLVGSVGGV